MADRNFDELAEHFMRKIYAGPKGQIRLAVLLRDLQKVGLLDRKTGTVLDAGGGLGLISRKFAKLGMQVTLVDISTKLLHQAQKEFTDIGLAEQVTIVEKPFQELQGEYDIVLCHAVLEWLDNPMDALQRLCAQTKVGGHLSLMFFNHTALVWKNLMFGKYAKLQSGTLSGFGTSLTPKHSFCRSDILQRLEKLGFELQYSSGVRLLRDYMKDEIIKRVGEAAIVEMELQYSQQEPYMEMARYIHFVAERKE
jgi:S-adenosylmethionine-dependent methyltransferase